MLDQYEEDTVWIHGLKILKIQYMNKSWIRKNTNKEIYKKILTLKQLTDDRNSIDDN